MPRVTKSLTAKAKHKKVLSATKGHYGARSRLFKTAKQSNIMRSKEREHDLIKPRIWLKCWGLYSESSSPRKTIHCPLQTLRALFQAL